MREKILINHDWRFLENPPEIAVPKTKVAMYLAAKTERLKWGYGSLQHDDNPNAWNLEQELSAEPWKVVDLPHDYIITQTPDPKESATLGFFKFYPAWYRKHFTLQPQDREKRLTIYFEGITGLSEIYLNGCFLKRNEGGYASFEVDITDLARFDQENVLAVYVDPSRHEGWWYAGGGIYRNVWLVKTDPVAVDLWGVYVPVEHLEGGATWRVPIEISIRNSDYIDVQVQADCEVLSPSGEKVAEVQLSGSAPAREVTVLTGETQVDSPQLWDIDSPCQYTLKVTVSKAFIGSFQLCDTYEQRFGFRDILMTPDKGLFLNGRNIKVKGVCMHLDCGLTGKAVPDNLCRYKVSLLKKMGANAFRASHYPHQEATMDACDELGLLVLDENRRFESCEDSVRQLEMLVKRDRNRPSVFMWSTGNEEVVYQRLEQGHRIQRALTNVIQKLDKQRPVTIAVNDMHDATLHGSCEVIGSNYSFHCLHLVNLQYPIKPFISTENCAISSSRGWYYGNSLELGLQDARDQQPDPTSFQCLDREQTWLFITSNPWLAGGFQWISIDHRGESAGWPLLSSRSGAIDLYLQKKDAFYQNQSFWLETPMIHVLPHWNHPGFEGVPMQVWAYTNCEEAELFLNGTSLGRQTVKYCLHAEWTVPYQPGRIEVVGYIGGERRATDAQETTGAPVSLDLRLETPTAHANGEDIALFTCLVRDEQGRKVPDASPLVQFACTSGGQIVGTGSSNTDSTPVPSPVRKMYAGLISVAVKISLPPAGATSTKLTLIARADGLRSAVKSIELPQD